MGKKSSVHTESGSRPRSAASVVREVLRSEADLEALSPEETAILTGQLTSLVARVERVRALGPAYAGVDVSPDVRELLTRLEVGSSLVTGVH